MKTTRVAINIQTLRTRTLTALVFVLVMFAGLFINEWTFVLLFVVVMLGCLYEYVRITKKISPSRYLYYIPFALLYIVLPVVMLLDLGLRIETGNGSFRVTYLPVFPCAIIFSIWINDTMAYIVGSLIGKTPLSAISPKKTWEGTIGGIVLCIVVMAIVAPLFTLAQPFALRHWVAIAAICAVFGTLGDLLESKLKRMANVKDSGHFMPGHGGFLDRFDSLLIAGFFAWIYIRLFVY